MHSPSRSLNPFRVLQTHRNFRLFWLGQTLSLVGTWMQVMAQGWLALELSNSALVVGLVASVGALPILLFSLHAGAMVDRSDRLRLVKITQAVFLLEAATLWVVTWSGHATIPVLLLLSLIGGTCAAIEIPARQSLIIQLVGRDDLAPAIALNSSGFNLARIIGPALGGLIIHALGLAWCFGVNALSYLAVLAGLFMMRLPSVVPASRNMTVPQMMRESMTSAMAGVRYLTQPGTVRDLLGLVTVGAVFGGPFITLMPVMARDQLGLGADGYGGLLASVGVGGLIAALVLAGPATHWRKGRVLVISSIGFPLLLLIFSFVTNVNAANILLLFIGCAMIVFNAVTNHALQLLVPDEYRGRLMALYSFVVVGLSQVAGALVAGAIARLTGVGWAIGGAATITLGYVLWTLRRAPELSEL
ncbi:MAG: MFS transporter [Phycisphaerae bacterium]|nr:MFS transporter [Gemmatimonadaceae bacterium]